MSTTELTQLCKKHRHRLGLINFFVGAIVGAILTKALSSPSSSSSSSRPSSGIKNIRSQSAPSQEIVPLGSGWKNIHVFYGDSKHIRDNSRITNSFFDMVDWYSQARQDEVVATLLRNKKNGYFIDLAANDPIKISNTYALEANFGWKGICFEPNPIYWAGLSYRTCDVVGAVIGAKRMEEVWFRFPNRAGPGGGITGDNFDNKGVSEFDEDKPRFTVTLVEVFEVFNVPKVIDYLSLDVEGAEDFIMKTFPFEDYRFNIMTLERPSEDMKKLLDKHGYKLLRVLKNNSQDTLFIHKSMEDKLDISAANLLDTNRRYTEVPSKRKADEKL